MENRVRPILHKAALIKNVRSHYEQCSTGQESHYSGEMYVKNMDFLKMYTPSLYPQHSQRELSHCMGVKAGPMLPAA